MGAAGRWELLKGGSCWKVGAAGRWELLEDGSCWKVRAAGRWELLVGGSCPKVGAAGRWELLEGGSYWKVPQLVHSSPPAGFLLEARRDGWALLPPGRGGGNWMGCFPVMSLEGRILWKL